MVAVLMQIHVGYSLLGAGDYDTRDFAFVLHNDNVPAP